MARARMAAGFPGSLGFNRSQVLLGMMLDTLPPIPPAEGAPPDDNHPGPGGPGQDRPDTGPNDGGPGYSGSSDSDRGQDRPGGGPTSSGPWDDLPAPRDEDAPPDDGLDDLPGPDENDLSWDPAEEDDDPAGTGPAPQWPALGVIPPALRAAASKPAGNQPATGRPATERPVDGRPVPGLLDVTLPWVTLTGTGARPGTLGRIGAITPVQARQLARAAEADPSAHWRIIVTNQAGQAIGVTRIRRGTTRHQATTRRNRTGLAPPYRKGPPGTGPPGTGPPDTGPPGNGPPGPPPGTGLVGRITLTISEDTLAQYGIITSRRRVLSEARGGAGLPPVAVAALRAAARARERARAQGENDRAAGGCAHDGESAGYRPPPRLREFVIARDVTCRNPACRQPAWRADLDHTIAYDHAGRTCRCNLGGACRRDHQLKQHPRWKLEQTRPGEFTWTTPAGRKYTAAPDIHPV
jgi:hypothetical protein